MQFVCYQDGKFLHEISLPLTTLAFTRGYAAFELLRTYGKIPFRLREHLIRLRQSAATLQIPYQDGLEEIISTLIKKNSAPELLIRIYLSEDELSGEPHLLILTSPLPAPPTQPLSIMTTPLFRQFPLVKSTCYVPALVALKEAAKAGAEDALFLSPTGQFLELTKSNFFAVLDDTLYTAPSGVLEGVTRGYVLELAYNLEIPVKESFLDYADLDKLEGAFSTSTTREILPIAKIDGTSIPSSPLVTNLQQAFYHVNKDSCQKEIQRQT